MYAAMSHFEPNGCIQRIGVCETLINNGHPVTYQTRLKENNSLEVIKSCNIQNVNQRNICSSHATGWTKKHELKVITHVF